MVVCISLDRSTAFGGVMVNNQIETIGSDRDIVDIIREHCGEDMASLIEYRLNVPVEENITPELIEECLQRTDYYAYESSLDDWNCVGNDVIEECNKQMKSGLFRIFSS